ncbi:ATP11 protein-domain-containing protein [Dipodascopsis uninucleata]
MAFRLPTCGSPRYVRYLASKSGPRYFDIYDRARFFSNKASSIRPTSSVTEKYKEKLESIMKEKGVTSYEELRKKYKNDIIQVRNRDKLKPPTLEGSKYSEIGDDNSDVKERIQTSSIPKVPKEKAIKTLSSYVDVEKLAQHNDPREIELIWRARHAHDPFALCAVISKETFELIKNNARSYPMFILPLPRNSDEEPTDTGTEIQFVQWTFPDSNTTHCLLTSLLEYKLHTEFARPHTTLIFHSELLESHGIVLLNGTIEKDMNISPSDAHFLVLTLQKFYNSDPRVEVGKYEREKALRRRLLLDLFKSGSGFDINELIREAEMTD